MERNWLSRRTFIGALILGGVSGCWCASRIRGVRRP
jgi:hypothetical protein